MSLELNSQMILPIAQSDKASFANYHCGENQELLETLQSSVINSEPSLIYFYGAQGSGKSHLLFAAVRLSNEKRSTNKRVKHATYLSLADTQVDERLLSAVDPEHIVCVDDAHHWAGDIQKEQALFTLFEQIKHAGGQLLVSAEQAPENSPYVLQDLISRLASGLMYAIQPLDEQQQYEAIKLRAQHRGLVFSDNAIRYLLSRSSRNTSELFVILNQVDDASLQEKRKITIPFLNNLLGKRF